MMPQKDPVEGVLTASRALVGVAARSLAAVEDDVTLAQYRVLVLLASRGEQNLGVLARALSIHPSSTTRLCDRLEAKGLISRTPSAKSRREVILAITATGRRLLKTVTARRRLEIRRIVDSLSRDEQRRVQEAFALFGRAAGELPDDAWQLGWT
jgi:DNA-binding MarR family transcriptional regulator